MSEDGTERSLLSERLRPQCFCDLTLPPATSERLQLMVDRMRPMNMIFYGPPGTGKTSAAQIFLRKWEKFDVLQLNGSLQTGVDFIRERVEGFARSPFSTTDLRLCFIDEADYLSASAQASLRVLIEQSEKNCRFLFAVNELDKIGAPLRSRLHGVNFSIPIAGRAAVQLGLRDRLAKRLAELGVNFDPIRLDKIVSLYFPDFRRIANGLEFEFEA
jgi:DNA polymerase III delta prime subunit